MTHAGWVPRRVPGMSIVDRDGLVLIDSGLPCDTFNFVCRARLPPDDAAARAAAAVAHFQRAGRPFSWWVGPADRPADLGHLLVSLGLERAEGELAMSADLADLRPDPAPDGLAIRRVRSPGDLEAFARVSAANWTPPDPQVVHFYEVAGPALLGADCPLWLYLGCVGDVPVATAELTVGGGVVGLYNISTLQAWRRRGFGTAMTVRPLLDAHHAGHRTAVLQAAPDGVGIYEKVGFRAFGDITEYKPSCSGADKVLTE